MWPGVPSSVRLRPRCYGALLLAGSTWMAAACGSPDAPVAGTTPSKLIVLAGGDLTDTISAQPLQGLVVQVLDAGDRPVTGVTVRFERPSDATCTGFCTHVGVIHVPSGEALYANARDSIRTDAKGRAVVRMQMGTRAGPDLLVVSVPAIGVTDTVHFTVLAGAPAALKLAPRDTVVEVGRTVALAATVTDRAGNSRGDAVAFESPSSVVRVSANGTVSATAPDAVYIRGRLAGSSLVDSARLGFVPVGRLAISDGTGIWLMSLVGSDRRQIGGPGASQLDWAPSGAELVYIGPGGIMITDTLGNARVVMGQGLPALPQYSADGQWIYYQPSQYAGARRIHPDGTGLRIFTELEWYYGNGPAPAPDGRRLFFTSYVAAGILDLETMAAAEVPNAQPAEFPRWSPDGQWIAFIQGYYAVILHPDGTGKRRFLTINNGPLAWSPDSRYLIGGPGGRMVDIVTGHTWTLPIMYGHLAWKH